MLNPTLARRTLLPALGLTMALSLAACGAKPDTATSAADSSSDFKACMLTDGGTINDKAFNQSAWKGLQDAQKAGKAKASYVISKSDSEFASNLGNLHAQGCGLILSIGALLQQATTDAAKSNPEQRYAIVDSPGNGKNVTGVVFNAAQASFLGGYLAAGMSKTGTVATYGGLDIPPVVLYMDGFWEGVQYYNAQNKAEVKVLGWNGKTQKGLFAGSFGDQTKGQTLATNFIQQGADVIFPVAGGTGLGTAATASTSKGKTSVLWVDTDGCVSAPQYCDVFLSTVVRDLTGAVTKLTEDAAGGENLTKDYVGTLANKGVGLAPFHRFDSKVPASLKSRLKTISDQIADGTIKITAKGQPQS